jgi:hypothetical protein
VVIGNSSQDGVVIHLGKPPGRVTKGPEPSPCGHFDDPACKAIPALETDPAVVRQDRGPTLDIRGGLKTYVRGGRGGSFVDGAQ